MKPRLEQSKQRLITHINYTISKLEFEDLIPDTWTEKEIHWFISDIVDKSIRSKGFSATYKNKASARYKDYRKIANQIL